MVKLLSFLLTAAVAFSGAGFAVAQEQDSRDDKLGAFFTSHKGGAKAGANSENESILNRFYVGGSGGIMTSNFPKSNQDGSVRNVDVDKTADTYKVQVGFEINDYVAVEGSYHAFGETSFSGVSDGSAVSWSPGDVSAEHELNGGALWGVGRLPLTQRFTLLAMLGLFWWNSTEKFSENGFTSQETTEGSDMAYGAGFEYDIGEKDNYVIRGEVNQMPVDDDDYDTTQVTVGMEYKF